MKDDPVWKRRGLNSVRDDGDGSDEDHKKRKPIIWKTKKREATKSAVNQPVSDSEHIHKSVDYLKE